MSRARLYRRRSKARGDRHPIWYWYPGYHHPPAVVPSTATTIDWAVLEVQARDGSWEVIEEWRAE